MKNFYLGLIFILGTLLHPGLTRANPIYSCDVTTAKCNGNTYALYVVSHVGDTWQLQFDIKVLSSYTGTHWTDLINAVEIKNFAPVFTNASLISAPDGKDNWVFDTTNELSANGCQNGNSDPACIQAKSPYPGAAFQDGDILSWLIQFDATTLNDTATIKYRYVNSAGAKVGDLGSWEIGVQRVPEPATVALTGFGLLIVGYMRRRRTCRVSI